MAQLEDEKKREMEALEAERKQLLLREKSLQADMDSLHTSVMQQEEEFQERWHRAKEVVDRPVGTREKEISKHQQQQLQLAREHGEKMAAHRAAREKLLRERDIVADQLRLPRGGDHHVSGAKKSELQAMVKDVAAGIEEEQARVRFMKEQFEGDNEGITLRQVAGKTVAHQSLTAAEKMLQEAADAGDIHAMRQLEAHLKKRSQTMLRRNRESEERREEEERRDERLPSPKEDMLDSSSADGESNNDDSTDPFARSRKALRLHSKHIHNVKHMKQRGKDARMSRRRSKLQNSTRALHISTHARRQKAARVKVEEELAKAKVKSKLKRQNTLKSSTHAIHISAHARKQRDKRRTIAAKAEINEARNGALKKSTHAIQISTNARKQRNKRRLIAEHEVEAESRAEEEIEEEEEEEGISTGHSRMKKKTHSAVSAIPQLTAEQKQLLLQQQMFQQKQQMSMFGSGVAMNPQMQMMFMMQDQQRARQEELSMQRQQQEDLASVCVEQADLSFFHRIF